MLYQYHTLKLWVTSSLFKTCLFCEKNEERETESQLHNLVPLFSSVAHRVSTDFVLFALQNGVLLSIPPLPFNFQSSHCGFVEEEYQKIKI
jgi:hypothetical protein